MRLGVARRRGVAVFVGAVLFLCAAASAAEAEEEQTQTPKSSDPGKTGAPAKTAEPRPPPLGAGEPATPPPWRRSIDVGIDLAFVSRPAASDDEGSPTPVRYDPGIGYGVHGRIHLLRHLRFTAYFVEAEHHVELPPGSLGQAGAIELDSVSMFSFGARLMPTWPFSDRLRSWLTVGAGWGRLEVDRMKVIEAGGELTVRERSMSFVEIPVGIGTSFDIVPRRLALEVEVTGAFVVGQQGSSIQSAQAIDAAGKVRSIGGFPKLDGSFVQTIGLSLLL
jgi:hypothetical protein